MLPLRDDWNAVFLRFGPQASVPVGVYVATLRCLEYIIPQVWATGTGACRCVCCHCAMPGMHYSLGLGHRHWCLQVCMLPMRDAWNAVFLRFWPQASVPVGVYAATLPCLGCIVPWVWATGTDACKRVCCHLAMPGMHYSSGLGHRHRCL